MIFTRDYATDVVTVDAWATDQEFTECFLRNSDGVRWQGDDIYIAVDNGSAHYRIVGRTEETETVKAVLVESFCS